MDTPAADSTIVDGGIAWAWKAHADIERECQLSPVLRLSGGRTFSYCSPQPKQWTSLLTEDLPGRHLQLEAAEVLRKYDTPLLPPSSVIRSPERTREHGYTLPNGTVSCPTSKEHTDREPTHTSSENSVAVGRYAQGIDFSFTPTSQKQGDERRNDKPPETAFKSPPNDPAIDSDEAYKKLLTLLMYGPKQNKKTPKLLLLDIVQALYLHNFYQLLGSVSSNSPSTAQKEFLKILNKNVFIFSLSHEEIKSVKTLVETWRSEMSVFYQSTFDPVSKDSAIRQTVEQSHGGLDHYLLIIQKFMEFSYDCGNLTENEDALSESLLGTIRHFPKDVRVDTLNDLTPRENKKLFKKQDLESVKKMKDKIKHIDFDTALGLLAVLIYQHISQSGFRDTLQLVSCVANIKYLTQHLETTPEQKEPPPTDTLLPETTKFYENPLEIFQRLYSGLTDPAFLLDENTRIMAMNVEAQNLFGFSGVELTGYSIQDLSPPQQADGKSSRATLKALMPELSLQRKLETAWKFMNMQGTIFPCRLTLLRLKTQNGDISTAVIKKDAGVEQTENPEGNFEAIVYNGSPWILKADKKIADMNNMAVRVLGGVSRTDFLGKGLSAIKPEKQPSGENTDEREMRKIIHALTNKRSMYYQLLKRSDATLLDVIVTAVSYPGYKGTSAVSAQLRVLHDPCEIASCRYVQWIDRYIQEVCPRVAPLFEDHFLQSEKPEFIFELVHYGDDSASNRGSVGSTYALSQFYSNSIFPVRAVNQAMLFLCGGTYQKLLGTNTVELMNTEYQVHQLNYITSKDITNRPMSFIDSTVTQELKKNSEPTSQPQPEQFDWYLMYSSFSKSENVRPVKLDILRLKIEDKTVFHAKVVSHHESALWPRQSPEHIYHFANPYEVGALEN